MGFWSGLAKGAMNMARSAGDHVLQAHHQVCGQWQYCEPYYRHWQCRQDRQGGSLACGWWLYRLAEPCQRQERIGECEGCRCGRGQKCCGSCQ
jgi:hypothetical protein